MTVRWTGSQLKTPSAMWAAAFPQALALIGVVAIVFATVRIPPEDSAHDVFIQIGVGMLVLFGPLGVWMHLRTRASVIVREERGVVLLDVTMPGLAKATYTGPFVVTLGQRLHTVSTGRSRIQQTELQVAVREEKSGKHVLLLLHVLGAAYAAPPGWGTSDASRAPFLYVLTTTFGRSDIEGLKGALTER